MACTAQSMISVFPSQRFLKKVEKRLKPISGTFSRIRACSNPQEDCNDEECAPDKEVGKVSMEWLVGEKTRIVGTYPPRRKGWTGYVEKDTAGQTNIYSVEPAVYVAESVISSGTAGTSSDGAENTKGITAFLGIISIAAASLILIQVGKNPPLVQQSLEYSGPSLSYYINKFKPPEIVEAASVISPSENSATAQLEGSEVSQVQVESKNEDDAAILPNGSNVS